MKKNIETGQRFGRLVIVKEVEHHKMPKEQIEKKAREIIGCLHNNCLECGGGLSVDNGCVEYQHIVEMADWLLDNLWISVEDELPPFDEEVIVRAINQRGEIMFFGHRSDNEYVVKDKYCFCSFDENETITHWMPIPKLNEK